MPFFKICFEITPFPKVMMDVKFFFTLAMTVFSTYGLFLSTALICILFSHFLLYLPSMSNEEVEGEV